MDRGVGYCENPDCDDCAKGVFLLNHGNTFYCPRCSTLGIVEPERGFAVGEYPYFKEARVEYNFDPVEKKFRETAIVRDDSLREGNIYTLRSPLIKTDKRALKVAEAILGNLNRFGLMQGELPRTQETIISFDVSREDFSKRCAKLATELKESALIKGQLP